MEKRCTWAASVISTVTKAVMSEIPHEEQAAPRQEFLYTIEARTPFSVVPSASIAHCLGCLFGTVRGMDSARHGTGLPRSRHHQATLVDSRADGSNKVQARQHIPKCLVLGFPLWWGCVV